MRLQLMMAALLLGSAVYAADSAGSGMNDNAPSPSSKPSSNPSKNVPEPTVSKKPPMPIEADPMGGNDSRMTPIDPAKSMPPKMNPNDDMAPMGEEPAPMPKSKSSPFEPSMEEKADMNRPVEPSTRMGMPEPGSSEMPSMEQQEDAPRMPYDPMNEPTGPAKPSAYHDSDSYAHESIIDSSSVDHMSNQDLDAAYDYVPSKQ